MNVNSIGNPADTQSGAALTTPASYSPPAVPTADRVVSHTSSVVAAATAPGSASTLTAEQAKKAVDTINASLTANGNSQNVEFAVDPSSKRVVIQVIDKQTNTVIRQIPNEDIIQMSMAADKKLGQVISQKA